MKRRITGLLLVLFIVVYCVVAALNTRRYCIRDGRFYNDEDFIEVTFAGIRRSLSLDVQTVADLRLRSPGCCHARFDDDVNVVTVFLGWIDTVTSIHFLDQAGRSYSVYGEFDLCRRARHVWTDFSRGPGEERIVPAYTPVAPLPSRLHQSSD